jgi:hypothetical protein
MNRNYIIEEDLSYWETLVPPKVPNEYEVSIFKENITGKVLLLGETKALRCLAKHGLDMFPTDFAKKGDWFEMKKFYDTIIGDGCLNFESGFSLLEVIKEHCDRFVCRVFGNEIKDEYTWKYAKCFWDEFEGSSKVIKTQKGCYIVVWDFD